MSKNTVKLRIFRFNPTIDKKSYYSEYDVPNEWGMSLMDLLDYVYENLDGSLAYYSHTACRHGVCARCTLLINGKPSLACQTMVSEDATIEPLPKFRVVRDLVYRR